MPTFIITALVIYGVANLFVFWHGWRLIPRRVVWRLAFLLFVAVTVPAYILSHAARYLLPAPLVSFLHWIGSWWIGFVLYLLLFTLAIDLIRLLNRVIPFFPRSWKMNPARAGRITAAAVVATTFLLLAGGYFNARILRVRTYTVPIGKGAEGRSPLSLVFFSDVHVGGMVGADHLEKIVDKVNSLRPDVVVLLGDMVDAEMNGAEAEAVERALSRLRAPLGVYAVLGNHEYIRGIEKAEECYARSGVVLLKDTAVRLKDVVCLVGRDDLSRRRRGGETAPLSELLAGVDRNSAVILLDHQPGRIEEAAAEGVDLLLCGHTHDGQLFPWGEAVKAFFPRFYGWYREGGTRIYVTSGAGTWGPPARVGNAPEIVKLRIEL